MPRVRPLLHAAFALSGAVLLATCDALSAPEARDVQLTFTSDAVVVVGGRSVLSVEATVDGQPLERPRYRLSSSDSGVVDLRGDTLVGRNRGSATITAQLLGSVLPDSIPTASGTVRVVVGDVTAEPGAATLTSLGDTVLVTATATDADGQPLSGVAVAWSSAAPGVATVSSQGHVVAVANGTASIRAVVDDDTATVAVTVAQALSELSFAPATVYFRALSDTTTITTDGLDARGNDVGALSVTWISRNSGVASVDAGGRVQAKGNGITFAVATAGDVADSVQIVVDQEAVQVVVSSPQGTAIPAIGDELQLVAVPTDAGGSQVTDDPVNWATLDAAVVAVSSLGRATGIGVGTAQIVASLDAAADTVTVTVSNEPVQMEVQPASATLPSVGDTLFLSARAWNVRSDLVQGLTYTWQTPDTSVALSAAGRVIAVARGTARVIGATGTIADTAVITVTNAPATLSIDTGAVSLASLGDSLVLPATIQNARGADLARSDGVWTVDNELIARVTQDGIVIARDTGETVVRVTSGGLTDQVAVQVLNLPDSLWLDSDLDTLTALGQQLGYHGDVWNARGNPIPAYPIQWETTNPSAVAVADSGWITAVGAGSAWVRGRAGSIADSIRVVVTDPTVYYVDNSTVIAPRFGSIKRPYQHIQDAIEAADARDTVYVFYGTGRYSESVALTRQVTLMGDTLKWFSSGLDQDSLTRIYHDTGWAAITAYTSAPVRIERLSIVHTLDGPAIDIEGSTANIREVYVNYGSGNPFDQPVGRGISIRNAPAGTEIAHTTVRAVNGYGVYLENTSEALILAVQTRFVDSIPGEFPGAGVQLRGGDNIRIQALQAYTNQGPHILADSTSNLDIVVSELWGCGMHMHLRDVNRAFGGNNNYDLRCVYEDSDPNLFTPALYFQNSTNVGFGSDTVIDRTDNNWFKIGYWWEDSRGGGLFNSYFRGGMENVRVTRSNVNLASIVSDSAGSVVQTGVWTSGDWQRDYSVGDTVRIERSSFSNSGSCLGVSSLDSWLLVDSTSFTNCNWYGAGMFDWYVHSQPNPIFNRLILTNSTFTGTGLWGMNFRGRYAELRGNVFRELLPGSEPGFQGGVVAHLEADTMIVVGNVITDNPLQEGLLLSSPQGPGNVPLDQQLYVVDSNLVARNQVGVQSWVFSSGNPVFTNNDIYDNDTLGIRDNLDGLATVANNWWGDDRGPERDAAPAATGDSVSSAVALLDPVRTTPLYAGTFAFGLRAVRGDDQSATAGTPLAHAFTVRVVDDEGRPVAGETVTFAVTAGGGTIDGGVTTLAVTSNASGLAEVTLTTGATPGANTVTATGAGQTLTFTATGT